MQKDRNCHGACLCRFILLELIRVCSTDGSFGIHTMTDTLNNAPSRPGRRVTARGWLSQVLCGKRHFGYSCTPAAMFLTRFIVFKQKN